MALTDVIPKPQKTANTKSVLRWAALFLGELRDGLTMVSSYPVPRRQSKKFNVPLTSWTLPVDQHAKRISDRRQRIL
jgi:hypothetical protein